MNSKSLRHFAFYFLLVAGMSILVYSCNKEEQEDIDPNKIELLSFGPSPALRGGELRFIGRNLDKVSTIVLPENVEVSTFASQTSEKITLMIPEATKDGKVVLRTPQGDIETKSLLTISEPITISTISPGEALPGATITITGTYLNLINEVIFKDSKSILKSGFLSHTQTEIKVAVPIDAQTGTIVLSNGMEDPILVGSENEFVVTLPVISSLSPNPVKPGKEIVIKGTNLDLVKEMVFEGNKRVLDFSSKTKDEIKVYVPKTAQDGFVKAVVASKVEISSLEEVVLVLPAITGISPDPVKPGKEVTISGTDLDLATGISFGGGNVGEITSKKVNELVAQIPITAVMGPVVISTASGKSVASEKALGLVQPVITSIYPLEIKANQELTIKGSDLDLVTDIRFGGDKVGKPLSSSEEEIIIKVPSGTLSGGIILLTKNGTSVGSQDELSIIASNVPTITEFPGTAKPGSMITLKGEKLDLLTDVIFPENVYATQFGAKTPTLMEVVVPENVKKGLGVITFITFEGETTTSPLINFQGVDPVLDESLVFFDFNGNGNKDSWWGNVVIVNEGNSLDGSSYGKIEGNYSGWTDLFWRNSNDNFPGAAIGTNVDDYVLKFDINILKPITGGNLKFRFHPAADDFWWALGPASPSGDGSVVEATSGWVTMTVEISAFKNNYGFGADSPTDLTEIPNEFGMAFDNGDSEIHVLIDNVRFEKK